MYQVNYTECSLVLGMYTDTDTQPPPESYPEVVESGHVYHHHQQPYPAQYTTPSKENWSGLEVAGAGPPALPPPPLEAAEAPRATVCGLRKRTFWILLLLAIVLVIAAVGGAVGGIISSKNKTPAAAASTVTNTAGQQTASGSLPPGSTPTSTDTAAAPTSTAATPEGGLETASQIIRTGLTAARYKTESDKWTTGGYQLALLTGYGLGTTDRYAAVWEPKSGPAISVSTALNSAQYQTDSDSMSSQGFFPVLVDAWTVNGADRFAAIWTDSEGKSIPAWVTRHGITPTAFQAEHLKWTNQGYCIRCLSGYALGTEARYTALWRECPGAASNATVLKYASTPGQYQTQLDTMTAQGYRVSLVNGYAVDNAAYYDSIFTLGSGPDWFVVYGMNAVNFQAKLEDMNKQGYRVTGLSGFTVGGNFTYSAVWDR